MNETHQRTELFKGAEHFMPQQWIEQQMQALQVGVQAAQAYQSYWASLSKYQADFFVPFMKAVGYFWRVEKDRILEKKPTENTKDFNDLVEFNTNILHQALLSSTETMMDYHLDSVSQGFSVWLSALSNGGMQEFLDWVRQRAEIINSVAHKYPQTILDIADEYGFHFERGNYEKVDETERFLLYKVLPTEKDVQVRDSGKPILIVHPYVLGADILAFLPGEKKSYVHCFANHGIPTYVRILKDINTNPAVQNICIEDDVQDTKSFCQTIFQWHKRPLTLNGYCQGGLMTMLNILTDELDGLVDTHITCMGPIDGTRSQGFNWFLGNLPDRFNALEYGTKVLPNGNKVADGDLMAWVYKIKSISEEAPTVNFYRDLAFWKALTKKGAPVSKTALALNYWLNYQRHDLPLEITRLSFISYNHPIAPDGTLPMKVGGRTLNMKHFQEKNIPWLICYGKSDTLVEKESALAPMDFIDVEVSPYPKGHVAIATSWSLPTSECALHECHGPDDQYRGPVRFHLDREQEQDSAQKEKKTSGSKTKKAKEPDEEKETPKTEG
ncbi:MAG: hypothetical protein U5L00_01910 [Desulfovermiculus sp.]|nr:hypothetical protein [Desulfovermiculus sp.]